MIGRRTPYTEAGIRRLRCARCKKWRAHAQWQICADGNQYRAICRHCDWKLNALVMRFMFPHETRRVNGVLKRYWEKLWGADA